MDDGGKLGENEIFDLEPDSPESPIKRKDFRVPHAEGEGTITGNVSAFQTSFNMSDFWKSDAAVLQYFASAS